MLGAIGACLERRGGTVDCALDVGCATGEFTNLLSHYLPMAPVGRVIGVDLSAIAIERATKRFPSLEFRAAALTDLAQTFEGSVDLLSCLEVLYYLPQEERARALETFAFTMKPGGLLLISSMLGNPPYLNHRQLCDLLQEKFSIIETDCLDLWPLVSVEKALLTIPCLAPRFDIARFLPGQTPFNVMRRLSRICGLMFGIRAHSHAFVLAELRR
jgi:SAM-dependent methyltransferase